jgi:hypothetical protein
MIDYFQRSVIAQKLLLQLLLKFSMSYYNYKAIFCIKNRPITITLAITVDNYNIFLFDIACNFFLV